MARTTRRFIVKETGETFQATSFRKQGSHVLLVVGYVIIGDQRVSRMYMPSELREIRKA